MAIVEYQFEGKKHWKIKVQKRDKDGKLKCKSTLFSESGKRITCPRKAKEIENKLSAELEKNFSDFAGYTWSAWHEECLQQMRLEGKKTGTLLTYDGRLKKWLNPEWAERDLCSFQKSDVHGFVYDYLESKGATDWTRRHVLKMVHRLFQMAIEEGIISRNPAAGIKCDVEVDDGRVLTPNEVETLLTKGKALNHEYYPHWVLALLTGMRCGELYALRWCDVNFEMGLVHVRRQFTGKDGVHLPKRGRTRDIDLGPELKDFLLELRAKSPNGGYREKLWRLDDRNKASQTKIDFVWEDLVLPRIRSWRTGMQARELKDFCKKIGITEIAFHDLRATHITNLLANGAAINKVMKQVGHRKMSTTDGYNRLTGVDVKGVTKNLSYGVPKELPDNVVPLFKNDAG